MIVEKQAASGVVAGGEARSESELLDDAAPSVTFSTKGSIPPVQPLQDRAAMPTASERAYGEVAAPHAAQTDEDGAAKAGPVGSRFSGDGELGDVERGFKTLKTGDTGAAVRKIQQALFELNFRPIEVNGTFDQLTADAVKAYQQQHKIAHKDGKLDGATFAAIEKEFFDLRVYASAAKHAPPGVHDTPKHTDADKLPVLLEETHALDDATKAEANAVISPSKDSTVGQFQKAITAGSYEARLEKMLLDKIAEEHKDAAVEKKHHDNGKLFSMDQMVDVGNAAKAQVDAVFNSWAVGKPMKAGVTLKDRYETDTAAQAKAPATTRHADARSRARYFMNTESSFADLDREHSVDRTRAEERGIIKDVLERVSTAKEKDLLLITATWSASTDSQGVIKLQRLKSGDEEQDRNTLWTKFGTMIHEYIHSLAHPAWRTYKESKSTSDSQAAHTLTEGVTELLTRTVVSQLNLSDKKLRKQVLGSIEDDGEEPDLDRDHKYTAAYLRAQTLVGVVGIHNLYAAYFLGETHLIGA